MGWEHIRELSNEAFRRLTGIQKPTFEKMIVVLREAQRQKTLQGGRPSKLSLEDRLLMTLEYLRKYRTYFHIGKHYDLSESAVYKTIGWIEDTLIQSRVFSLPGRKARLKSDMNYEVVLVGCYPNTYSAAPKKQRRFYSGKKKRPRLKTQLVVDKASQQVICTSFISGKRHDFHLFKQSGVRFQASTQRLTDSGYQGLQKIHANSLLAQETTTDKAREAGKQDHRQSAGTQRERH